MATKKFSIQPYKDTGTLTSFNAPQTRSSSYQTTAPEMIKRQTDFRNLGKSLGNLSATIIGTPKSKASEPSGSYNNLFVGGQGTAVGSQPTTKPSTKSPTIFEPLNTATTLEAPSAPSGDAPAGAPASTNASASGSVSQGAGGYTPPGLSPIEPGIDTGIPSPKTVQAGTTTGAETRYLPDGTPINAGDSRYSTASATQPTGTTSSKYEQGFNAANTALGGQAPPKGQALATVQSYSPGKSNDTASTYVQTDPFIDGLVKTWQDYINPTNQRKSLADTYNQMIKDSGVQALDTELLDMKNVIEGSEDDLRNEITKAGGFATESQIQGLTNARNKQLIKNYNTLLDTRNSKEKYLQTAIGLEQADRQSADQKFESMFSMGTQIATLQNQMTNNAKTQMQWLAEKTGFDGLYNSTGGDPYYTNLIEKTLGLPSGGLESAAGQAQLVRQQEQQKANLQLEESKVGMELKREQIKTEQAQRSKIYADTQEIINKSKGTVFDLNTPEGQKQAALGKARIDQIGGIINSGNLNTAVGPNVFSRYGNLRNIFRPGSANFIGDVEQLRSQLNLQSLIDAKSQGATFGALSDQELQVLSTAGTKIGNWAVKDKNGNVTGYKVKESDFKKELDKINNFAKLDYIYRGGNTEDVGVQLIDGKYYTQNSDGSVTEL